MLNNKLAEILDWAEAAGVDLERTEITLSYQQYDSTQHKYVNKPRITFYHDKEKADNIRRLKRVVELQPKGTAPYIGLHAIIILGDAGEVELMYEGAFECKVAKYDCKPKGWADHQLESKALDEPDVMMED